MKLTFDILHLQFIGGSSASYLINNAYFRSYKYTIFHGIITLIAKCNTDDEETIQEINRNNWKYAEQL